MMCAGVLGAAGLALLWWDLVDFVLDRVGHPHLVTAHHCDKLTAHGEKDVAVVYIM